MIKHTKYFLGATLFYFTTVTVVYGSTPKELCQNSTNVLSKNCEEVRVDGNSEVLLSESNTKSFIIVAPGSSSGKLFEGAEKQLIQVLEKLGLRELVGENFQAVTGLIDGHSRNIINIFLMVAGEKKDLMRTYTMAKDSESRRIKLPKPEDLNTGGLRIIKVGMIPGSYPINLQSNATQQIDLSIPIRIRSNFYIDIRTKVTYLKTLLDALEKMKKLDSSPNWNRIREQVRSDLKNNIEKLSDPETLVQQFKTIIPNLDDKNLVTSNEKIFLEFAMEQIKAQQIEGLKEAVDNVMIQNLDKSLNRIISILQQEARSKK